MIELVWDELKTRTEPALEAIRDLAFKGEYGLALSLTRQVHTPSPEILHWTGICLSGLNRPQESKSVLLSALARGHQGVSGALAGACRQLGENTLWLTNLTEADLNRLTPFERAAVQRETGLAWEIAGRLEEARHWLTCAWATALAGEHGRFQLAFIGQVLGRVLDRLGRDREALPVLDLALRHANRTRHLELLYRRAMVKLHLGRLEAAEDDLAEMQMFVPDDPTLPALVAYTQGGLERQRGELKLAEASFRLATHCGWLAGSEVEAYALVQASAVAAELGTRDGFERAQVYLDRTRNLSISERAGGQVQWRRALVTHRARQPGALELAQEATATFQESGFEREHTWSTLLEAEILLDTGYPEAASHRLRLVAGLVAKGVTKASLQLELRLLPAVRRFAAASGDAAFNNLTNEVQWLLE